jgi:hypothetical protein
MLVSGCWIQKELVLIYPESSIKHPGSARLKQSFIYAANSSVWGGASLGFFKDTQTSL